MKQEDIDILMGKIDKRCKLPKHWDEFIKKQTKSHHIIIKDRKNKELYCTNCKNSFINRTIKVKDYVGCPNCKQKSEVFGTNYYRKSFEKSILLVQRMNKQIVIRVFEIYSYFNECDKNIKTHCIEYARILPGIGRFLGNNVYIGMFGAFRVYHGYKKLNWYKYQGHHNLTDFTPYPYNKKRLLKGTNMEYAPINEFLDRFSYYRYNFLDVLELAAYESFEMLWNMKLYNLCFYSKSLNKKGSFYKRFGVPKSFLKFMQDNDIHFRELRLLQLFQKDDKELLNKYRYDNLNYLKFLIKNDILEEFKKFNDYIGVDTYKTLKEIGKYIPLKKLKNYPKGLNNLYIYKDYLEMANKLALNYKAKKDLFPRNLISRHDKLQAKIKITEDMNTQFAAYLRYYELSKYTYESDKYIIFPATSIDSMKDEGKQQGNCVGYLYLNPYIKKETEIYFIRMKKDITKSFITLEYKENKIVQKELPHHSRKFEQEHLNFIDNWLGFREFIDKKLKYQNINEVKIVKYNLNKMVA